MRAALLARVSSEGQATEDRHSLPAQIRAMREFAEARQWVVVREFVAPGESASTNDLARRPVIRDVLAAAGRQEFDVLVIHEASRLARDVEMAHRLINELDGLGVRLVNASTGQDYYSSSGRFMYTIESGLAEFTRRQMGEHIAKGKHEAWVKGLHLGQPPFGYTRGADGALQVVPDEREAIREAFDMRIRGSGYMEIARMLARRGMRPRSRRGYSDFTLSSVQSLLENPLYAGAVVHKGKRRPGLHEALVTLGEFEAAQRTVRRTQISGRMARCLLTGMAICHACGGPLWMTETGTPRWKKPAYREAAHQQYRQCPNDRTMWRAHLADEEVARLFRGIAMDRRWIDEHRRRARRPAARGRSQRAISAERERWGIAFAEGAISSERMRAELARLDEEERAKAPDINGLLATVESLTSIGDAWDVATLEQKREAVRIVFDQVRIDTRAKAVHVVPRETYRPLFGAMAAGLCADIPPAGESPSFSTQRIFAVRELVA